MKKLIKFIREAINSRQKLAKAESFIKYLQFEVEFLRDKSGADNFAINDLIRENESISGANSKLVKELAAIRHLQGKERALVDTCLGIYSDGKTIKKRTFERVVGAVARARSGGADAESTSGWGCGSGLKGGETT